jgi:glyoxylase-like metal-dependent hydrolase (beta-lactamase superfamily II)
MHGWVTDRAAFVTMLERNRHAHAHRAGHDLAPDRTISSMSEPSTMASAVEEVVPGVWHWRLADDRIGGATSAAHAVRGRNGTVLIDPLPLAEDALAGLAPVEAICLTAQCHQRSSWRYRRQFGARVFAPETRPMQEEPDERYRAGDLLPGGLRVIHTPGPEVAHFSFLLEEDPGVLFCSDLLCVENGRLEFVPFEYHEDPATTRRSTEQLLDLPFSVLCLDHGPPVVDDPHGAISELLARTSET